MYTRMMPVRTLHVCICTLTYDRRNIFCMKCVSRTPLHPVSVLALGSMTRGMIKLHLEDGESERTQRWNGDAKKYAIIHAEYIPPALTNSCASLGCNGRPWQSLPTHKCQTVGAQLYAEHCPPTADGNYFLRTSAKQYSVRVTLYSALRIHGPRQTYLRFARSYAIISFWTTAFWRFQNMCPAEYADTSWSHVKTKCFLPASYS